MASIYVLFGRPGSGKSTLASSTVLAKYLEQNNHIAVDLDVCITQQMKDNFALGIYPSLTERNQFITSACDYVDGCIRKSQCHSCLVTFSFVNSDMRDIFRARFPTTKWILIDTAPEEANKRISERQGHFYKNKMSEKESSSDSDSVPIKKGSEWYFADVDFDHIRLNGLDEIDDNVNKLISIIDQYH